MGLVFAVMFSGIFPCTSLNCFSLTPTITFLIVRPYLHLCVVSQDPQPGQPATNLVKASTKGFFLVVCRFI